MVGRPRPEMKGLEGHAVAFCLEPKVARRCNLGGGREGELERGASRRIDTEGNMDGRSGGEDEFADDTDGDTSPVTDVNTDEVLNWQLALSVGNMLVHWH